MDNFRQIVSDNSTFYPGKNQFIISKKIYNHSKFKRIDLEYEYYLSYDENLRIKKATRNNKDCYILGYSVQSDKNQGSPEEEIIDTNRGISDIIYTWAGRWVLIYDNVLYTDALQQLAIYYGRDMISSSVGLIRKNSNDKLFNFKLDNKRYEYTEDSTTELFPAPLTQVDGIFALLCGYTISFSDKINIIQNEYLILENNKISNNNLRYFKNIMIYLLKNISSDFKDIYIPLTGGIDSRMTFLLSIYSKINFSSFTYRPFKYNLKNPESKRLLELIIPMLISGNYNIEHNLIEPEETCDKRMEIMYYHIGFHINYNRYEKIFEDKQMDKLKPNAITIESSCFEIFRKLSDQYEKLNIKIRNNNDLIYESILEQKKDIDTYKECEESLKIWIETLSNYDNEDLTISMLYDIQQHARQCALFFQIKDLSDQTNIPIINSGILLSLLKNIRKTNDSFALSIVEEDDFLSKYTINPRRVKDLYAQEII